MFYTVVSPCGRRIEYKEGLPAHPSAADGNAIFYQTTFKLIQTVKTVNGSIDRSARRVAAGGGRFAGRCRA
ncbi:MAG: hypothetical protein WB853_00655, partial [Desulfobacterales bacterium]